MVQKKKVKEVVVKVKRVPDDELNKYFKPKPKPKDHTQAMVIAPLTAQIYRRWVDGSLISTLHIISKTSCFEICFDLGTLLEC